MMEPDDDYSSDGDPFDYTSDGDPLFDEVIDSTVSHPQASTVKSMEERLFDLLDMPGNWVCAECAREDNRPTWASFFVCPVDNRRLAVLICPKCAHHLHQNVGEGEFELKNLKKDISNFSESDLYALAVSGNRVVNSAYEAIVRDEKKGRANRRNGYEAYFFEKMINLAFFNEDVYRLLICASVEAYQQEYKKKTELETEVDEKTEEKTEHNTPEEEEKKETDDDLRVDPSLSFKSKSRKKAEVETDLDEKKKTEEKKEQNTPEEEEKKETDDDLRVNRSLSPKSSKNLLGRNERRDEDKNMLAIETRPNHTRESFAGLRLWPWRKTRRQAGMLWCIIASVAVFATITEGRWSSVGTRHNKATNEKAVRDEGGRMPFEKELHDTLIEAYNLLATLKDVEEHATVL